MVIFMHFLTKFDGWLLRNDQKYVRKVLFKLKTKAILKHSKKNHQNPSKMWCVRIFWNITPKFWYFFVYIRLGIFWCRHMPHKWPLLSWSAKSPLSGHIWLYVGDRYGKVVKIGLFWFPPAQIGTISWPHFGQFLPKNSESGDFSGYYDVITVATW